MSSERQVDNYSLSAQERAIRDACTQRGYELVAIYRDEGISARSDNTATRPQFAALTEDVKRRLYDVVFVHSVDRISRSLLALLIFYKCLSDAKTGFVSLSDAVDYTTPEGKLQLQIQGAVAEMFSANLAKHVAKGKSEAARQGFANGRPPLGYVRDGKSLLVDDKAAAVVRSLYDLAAQGRSLRSLCPVSANAGYPLSRCGIRWILGNRAYLGQVRHRKDWMLGQHPAIIDAATWQQVQDRLRMNKRWLSSGERVKLYSGLLVCALCGSPMHYSGAVGNHLSYSCARRRDYADCRAVACGQNAISKQVAALLAQVIVPEDVIALALAATAPPVPIDRDAVNRRMERLRETYELGDIDRERYLSRRADLLRERDAAPAPPPVYLPELAARLSDLPALWAHADDSERRALVTRVVRSFLVKDGRIVAFAPADAFAPVIALAATPHPERQGFYLCAAG